MKKKRNMWKTAKLNLKWKIKSLKAQWWIKDQISLEWKDINEQEYRAKKITEVQHGVERGSKIRKRDVQIMESNHSA